MWIGRDGKKCRSRIGVQGEDMCSVGINGGENGKGMRWSESLGDEWDAVDGEG